MKTSTKALLASASVLVLTVLHHAYGAIIYATPWRYHVAFIAVPVLVVLALAYGIHRRRPGTALGRVSLWFFILVALLVPVAVIGLFEGGYNHALKNLLYFGGASADTLARVFPPPRYELPNDLSFEVTGVLQFVTGLIAARYLVELWLDRRREGVGSRAARGAHSRGASAAGSGLGSLVEGLRVARRAGRSKSGAP